MKSPGNYLEALEKIHTLQRTKYDLITYELSNFKNCGNVCHTTHKYCYTLQ